MKKIVATILSAAMITATIPAVAADNEIKVFVDGEQLRFDVQPQIINDYTMVPMRAIFEKLGYSVEWNDELKTVFAYNAQTDKEIILTIGWQAITYFNGQDLLSFPSYYSDEAMEFMNNNTYTLDTAPVIIDGSTFVPVRAISEASDCTVIWDGNNSSVNIFTEELIPISITTQEPSQEDLILPTITPTEEPEDTAEAKIYTYFNGIDLIDYGKFNDVVSISSPYGYNYNYDLNNINDYISAIEGDGWTCVKNDKHNEDYILTKGEQKARILWGKSVGTVIIIKDEYIDTSYYTVMNKCFEQIAKLDENEKLDDNKESHEDMSNSDTIPENLNVDKSVSASAPSSSSGSSAAAPSGSSGSGSTQYAYIGNKNSYKFHRPSCSTLPNKINRVYFATREEAVNAGMVPCKLCNP